MDADTFIEAVRGESKTELSRLSSSKALYADTGGEMDEDPVLSAVADALYHASETFEDWADASDGDAGEYLAGVAATASEQYGVVAGELGGHEPDEAPALVAFFGDLDTAAERVAGAVAWAIVTEGKVGQAVGFFVGQAAPGAADTFRDVRDTIEAEVEAGARTLEAVCEDEGDWDLAEAAAVGAIEAAYDEYFETLEAMGVNPKPVC